MVNQRLRAARIHKRWSMTVASEMVGVDRVTYSRWERGEQAPHPTTLGMLCHAFEESPENLGYDAVLSNNMSQERRIVRLTDGQLVILRRILGENGMTHFDPAKRETLRQIAIALGSVAAGTQAISDPEPWERLSMALGKPSEALPDVALDRFEHLIGEAWKLSNINELEAAEGVLLGFLPRIIAISQQGSDSRVAYIASQGLRLQSIIIHHRLHISEKVSVCQQSVEHARHADDANTLVAALLELAVAYKYHDQPNNWFKTMQEDLYCAPQASSLLQSQAYLKSALAFDHHKRTRDADLYLQLGLDTFPDEPEHDPGYALADSNMYTFSRDTGRVQLEMGRVSEAYGAFELYKSSPLPIPERLRMEIVNAQCRVAILENDLEKYASFLKDGLASALVAGSKKRFEEAYTTFKADMPASWLSNREIKDIAEQYQLRRWEGLL